MIGEYYWKLLKGEMLSEPEPHGPYYDEFRLNDGPFADREEAITALQGYYRKFKKEYNHNCREEFVLIEVFSDSE